MVCPSSIDYIIKLMDHTWAVITPWNYYSIDAQDRRDDSKAALLVIILFKSTVICSYTAMPAEAKINTHLAAVRRSTVSQKALKSAWMFSRASNCR